VKVFFIVIVEIWGVGHDNMPIVVEGVSVDKYILWLSEKV
jgi:heme/copper-type cytochrome/quinol oxidase subunit 2